MALRFVTSEKGKLKLFHEGHFYYKDKAGPISTYWRCERFQSHCSARAITDVDMTVRTRGEHDHAGDADNVEAQQDTRDTPTYIISETSSGVSLTAVAKAMQDDEICDR